LDVPEIKTRGGVTMGGKLDFLNRKVRKLHPQFMEMLEDLKQQVEKIQIRPDIKIVGDPRKIKAPPIITGRFENWVVGYRVRMKKDLRSREILIKLEGYTWDEIPDPQKDIYFYSIMEVLVDKNSYDPEIRMYDNGKTIQITQNFIPWEFGEEIIHA